ncbi:MAG: HDIG domain-containing protein [Treponema sp.]|jgi:putative nucleotidyltransferase with HDIG domain|nr:HDIG domain-containing protein [Treponema sp.]
MKKNLEGIGGESWKARFKRTFFPSRPRPFPLLVAFLAFAVTVLNVIFNSGSSLGAVGDISNFEAGRVADRDVVAEHSVSYVDEDATRLRLEAQERLVPAVFRFSPGAAEGMRNAWRQFTAFTDGLFHDGVSADAFVLKVRAGYPGFFSDSLLDRYYRDPQREQFGKFGALVFENILERGIFALPHAELEPYNPDVLELLSVSGGRSERERLSYQSVITMDKAAGAVGNYSAGANFPPAFAAAAPELLLPFIAENVFFSPEDSRRRVAETVVKAEPVVKYIDRGKRIIRKGFIISEEDMKELRALHLSLTGWDPRLVAGQILVLFLVFALLVFLCGRRVIGRSLTDREIYLLTALASLYIIMAVFAKNLPLGNLPVSVALPTALVVMLPAILIGQRLALILTMVLPLGACMAGSFDTPAYIFALASGVTAVFSLQGSEKRMDLIKAGLSIAAANCVAMIAILLVRRDGPGLYPTLLAWSALNGLGSGMLVLGFLPPLEHLLNAATTFRLIELSDLNSPMLKRLFAAAPGTYSHSIMVANLAESACQDIGANSLLARVGAYYHDIGKMENPDYFVENQTVYNKHDDLAPRLSATVIRSHLKLGVEKARIMGLPREVIDIVAEHHGNSVIAWFYNEALKRESAVNMEDFTYPGNPPRSRESAVVMLADVTEAAVRTLKKPTAARMEKFIQELVNAKVEHGQLSESELTFRDLAVIEKAFVRVLAGHYHSRIEYPKPGKEGDDQ